jgi:hypothetical protein
VLTAHHWRSIRLKLTTAGILDPMMLPSMHVLLDLTETSILEAMHGKTAREGEMQRATFLDQLYAPTLQVRNLNGDKTAVAPDGFDIDDVEDSFDAFAKAAL